MLDRKISWKHPNWYECWQAAQAPIVMMLYPSSLCSRVSSLIWKDGHICKQLPQGRQTQSRHSLYKHAKWTDDKGLSRKRGRKSLRWGDERKSTENEWRTISFLLGLRLAWRSRLWWIIRFLHCFLWGRLWQEQHINTSQLFLYSQWRPTKSLTPRLATGLQPPIHPTDEIHLKVRILTTLFLHLSLRQSETLLFAGRDNTRARTAADNSLTVNIPTLLNKIQHAHTEESPAATSCLKWLNVCLLSACPCETISSFHSFSQSVPFFFFFALTWTLAQNLIMLVRFLAPCQQCKSLKEGNIIIYRHNMLFYICRFPGYSIITIQTVPPMFQEIQTIFTFPNGDFLFFRCWVSTGSFCCVTFCAAGQQQCRKSWFTQL